MKKMKLLYLLLVLLASQRLIAVNTLVVWHADGTTTDIELSMLPRIMFVENKIMIQAPELQMEIDEKNVSRFTYKSSEASDISAIQKSTSYTQQNGSFIFHGISTEDKVTIYKMNGVRVPIRLEHRGDDLVLPLMALPSGVYLLTVNGRTTKLIVPR